jgi:hypothetical protein
MPSRRSSGFVASMLLVAAARTSGAQPAQTDFDRATQLAARGDCRSAIPLFEASYQAQPRPSTLLHLARCHEKTGDRDTAAAYYRSIIDDGRNPDAVREARAALHRLRAIPGFAAPGTPSGGPPIVRTEVEPKSGWGVAGSVGPMLVVPWEGGFSTAVSSSPGLSIRLGGERRAQPVGFSPALRFDYVQWFHEPDVEIGYSLHLGVDARVLLYGDSTLGFVSVGAGLDEHRQGEPRDDTSGTGLNFGVGWEGRASRRVAVGVAVYVHPKTSELVIRRRDNPNSRSRIDVEYVAIQLEASVY